MAEREAILAVGPPDPAVHIRAAELQRGRLQREREDLAAGNGRYRDHPVAHAIWELHHAEVNIARLERNLAESRPSRPIRKMWRSELADRRSRSVLAARAVEELSAPALARVDTEKRGRSERLFSLWGNVRRTSAGRTTIRRHPVASITSPAKSPLWTPASTTAGRHMTVHEPSSRESSSIVASGLTCREGSGPAPTRSYERPRTAHEGRR